MRRIIVGGLVAANLFMVYKIHETMTRQTQEEIVVESIDEVELDNTYKYNKITEEYTSEVPEYIPVEPTTYNIPKSTKPTARQSARQYEVVRAIVTAYAPYDNKSGICANEDPSHTATMTRPRIGVLAADPKRLPYGTEIFVPGYGMGVVEDTGGALRSDKNNIRIDVFMNTHAEAMKWGRQELYVIVYK